MINGFAERKWMEGKRCPPKEEKFEGKLFEFEVSGKLDPMIIDENNMLVDGYCSYLIAKQNISARRKAKIYRAKELRGA